MLLLLSGCSPQSFAVIGGGFSEVTGFRVHDAGIKDAMLEWMSATHWWGAWIRFKGDKEACCSLLLLPSACT